MIKSEEYVKKVSIGLTHYLYRNTELEELHSKGVIMNQDIYLRVYDILTERISKVDTYFPKIYGREIHIDPNTPFADLQKEPDKLFACELDFCIKWGIMWDEPTIIPFPPFSMLEDRASYLLDGLFKIFCESNQVLDDVAMYYLNKDVCNRVFTLVKAQKLAYPLIVVRKSNEV